jgi:hypothetical protein
MLRKDYIIRLTEEFGKFIGIVFSLKNQDKWEELDKLINESAKKFTNIEIVFVESLPDENLPERLFKEYGLTIDNIKMLADLLYEKGLNYSKLDEEIKSLNAYKKSMLLFRYVNDKSLDSDFSLDMHYKMKTLEQLLGLK